MHIRSRHMVEEAGDGVEWSAGIENLAIRKEKNEEREGIGGTEIQIRRDFVSITSQILQLANTLTFCSLEVLGKGIEFNIEIMTEQNGRSWRNSCGKMDPMNKFMIKKIKKKELRKENEDHGSS